MCREAHYNRHGLRFSILLACIMDYISVDRGSGLSSPNLNIYINI